MYFILHFVDLDLNLNKLLENKKLDKFYCSNFKLDITQVRCFVFMRNSNLIKLETLVTLEPKLSKLASKLKLNLQKFIFLELDTCSNSKLSSSMKLEFDAASLIKGLTFRKK